MIDKGKDRDRQNLLLIIIPSICITFVITIKHQKSQSLHPAVQLVACARASLQLRGWVGEYSPHSTHEGQVLAQGCVCLEVKTPFSNSHKASYGLAASLTRITALTPQTLLRDTIARLLQVRKQRLRKLKWTIQRAEAWLRSSDT